ncbi:MAG TPA: C40 family peptidase [Ignavibacteriaceae bacterium]|nr:C40 family peptidase [Ignavibacteriaceae bacterium]
MKIFSLIILISFSTITAFSQENEKMDLVNSIIESVKNKYAPDKRVALFDIEADASGSVYLLNGETNLPEAKMDLMEQIKKENISVKDEIKNLPAEELGDKIYGVINLSVANLRSNPDHPAELSTQSILGTPIKILKKGKGGFYLVQTPDGYISWLDNGGFHAMTKDEINTWLKSDKIIYLEDYGFAFSQPDKKSLRVSDLAIGNLLKLVGEEKDFYKVNFPDGREAFVKRDECKLYNDWYAKVNPTAENILKEAHRFMGVPYLWGGTSSKGMDCSGFTKTVFFLNGIILPRDASQQVHTGELVDTENGWENLKPGDLLFYGSKATEDRKERITHVSIYIGDGDFIHAAGRVQINSFNPDKPYYSDYRKSGFIRAKRILNSIGTEGIDKIKDNSFYKLK